MKKAKPKVEEALEALRLMMREKPKKDSVPPRGFRVWPVPEDMQTDAVKSIGVTRQERRALDAVHTWLMEDMRFEHMDNTAVEQATWRFACQCALRAAGGTVAKFIAEYAQEPTERVCYFPVENLTVAEQRDLFGVTFMPVDAGTVPANMPWRDPRPTMGSVIAVACRGTTNYTKMRTRARFAAEHALRLLRATLRKHPGLHSRQLRFRLGEVAWLDDGLSGWDLRPEEGWPVELNDHLAGYATSQAISTVPLEPEGEMERRANLALRWYERAQLTVDPVVELLCLFSALEALLGDKDKGLKAPRIARRRAALGAITRQHFAHPIKTYMLYDEARSKAVHGEEPPDVPADELSTFAFDVREAINEFLEYARDKKFVKRKRVTDALERSEEWETVETVVRPMNPALWDKCFGAKRDTSAADDESAHRHAR